MWKALLPLALMLVGCTRDQVVVGADGGPDAPLDAAPLPDSPDAPDDAGPPDAGWLEGPPWRDCPPDRSRWADPLAEAAAARFFSRARTGDPCEFGFISVCGGFRAGAELPIPGLELGIDEMVVACVNGFLVLSARDSDCGGEIPDAPWAAGPAWLASECTAAPDLECTGEYRCVRVVGDCCVDIQACDELSGASPAHQRVCDPSCTNFPGGRTWTECPTLGTAVAGEPCSFEGVCPAPEGVLLTNPVQWCDGEHYRLVFDLRADFSAACPSESP